MHLVEKLALASGRRGGGREKEVVESRDACGISHTLLLGDPASPGWWIGLEYLEKQQEGLL